MTPAAGNGPTKPSPFRERSREGFCFGSGAACSAHVEDDDRTALRPSFSCERGSPGFSSAVALHLGSCLPRSRADPRVRADRIIVNLLTNTTIWVTHHSRPNRSSDEVAARAGWGGGAIHRPSGRRAGIRRDVLASTRQPGQHLLATPVPRGARHITRCPPQREARHRHDGRPSTGTAGRGRQAQSGGDHKPANPPHARGTRGRRSLLSTCRNRGIGASANPTLQSAIVLQARAAGIAGIRDYRFGADIGMNWAL